MTTPLWMLLGFAGWTMALLLGTVGVYRWIGILSRRNQITDFRADVVEGAAWYKRAMRAHANCVENLPVFGAIVVVASLARIDSVTLDRLSVTFLLARIGQSVAHVGFGATNRGAWVRWAFFTTQLLAMIWMGIHVALAAS